MSQSVTLFLLKSDGAVCRCCCCCLVGACSLWPRHGCARPVPAVGRMFSLRGRGHRGLIACQDAWQEMTWFGGSGGCWCVVPEVVKWPNGPKNSVFLSGYCEQNNALVENKVQIRRVSLTYSKSKPSQGETSLKMLKNEKIMLEMDV